MEVIVTEASTAPSLTTLRNVWGAILTAEAIEEWEQVDSDEAFDELIRDSGAVSTAGYDVANLRANVEKDRDLLRSFVQKARQVTQQNDPKLKALLDALLKVLHHAMREDNLLCLRRRKFVLTTQASRGLRNCPRVEPSFS